MSEWINLGKMWQSDKMHLARTVSRSCKQTSFRNRCRAGWHRQPESVSSLLAQGCEISRDLMNTSGHRMPVLNHVLGYSISRARRKLLRGWSAMQKAFSPSGRGRLILLLGCLYDLFIYRQVNFPGEENGGRFHPDVYRYTEVLVWPWKPRPGLVAAIELGSF